MANQGAGAGATGDIRLMLVSYLAGKIKSSEDDVINAIKDPEWAKGKLGGGSGAGAGGAGGAGATSGSSSGSGDKGSNLSTSTEAYGVQYFVGNWTTISQLATSTLKSMNDSMTAVARNI